MTRDGGKSWDRYRPQRDSVAGADAELVQIAVGGKNLVRFTRDAGKSWQEARKVSGNVFWIHIQDGGVWVRTDTGFLGRLESDLSWADDGPVSDVSLRRHLTDVLILPRGAWAAIAIDGALYHRCNAMGRWRIARASPASLACDPGTWRLARTSQGCFAWRYEGGLCAAPRLGERWVEVGLPNGVRAIGGVCGDPRGDAAVWMVATNGELFRVTTNKGSWDWQQLAGAWTTGRCAFLDAVASPPLLLGSGPGGLYSFPVRN